LLGEVEVPNAANRLDDYPHQYSGGMRQRVMIAIALANRPDVLIADEPTTALDMTTQAQVLDLLGRLVEQLGTAVILITHNLGIVAEFCDEVNVMYAGRFVEQGTTTEVFARHVHPYTEALLESVPRPDMVAGRELPFIPGVPPPLAQLPPGCSFEPRCRYGGGRAECVGTAPEQVVLADGRLTVECHFARERYRSMNGGA
jgi:oligopeptide/dipeptide ABC transporter ATP-binding protein